MRQCRALMKAVRISCRRHLVTEMVREFQELHSDHSNTASRVKETEGAYYLPGLGTN